MFVQKCIFSVVFAMFLFSDRILVNTVDGLTVLPTNDFLLRFEERLLSVVKNELSRVNITFVKQIIPNVFLFRDNGSTSEIPDILKNNEELKGKVTGFERVHEYIAEMWTKSAKTTENYTRIDGDMQTSDVSTYFDMGVEGAWRQNYTGKGIRIAVTDVGVNKDVKDLQPNIDTNTSYNAVDSEHSTNVTPEEFDDYPETMVTTDHGNRCAGMISALRNGICGDGVAYDAKIAVLKIFKAHYDFTDTMYPHGRIIYTYPIMAEGIYHAIQTVDIYSNSWGTNEDFMHSPHLLDLVMVAVRNGISLGRDGKGAIHVFPAGNVADPFANSIYTIAVSSLGQKGQIPEFSKVCACTLTTAYGQGCDSAINPACDTSHMLTTSRRGCTQEFCGTSASTAIVSGIIGLALQANANLGWREVQDLVVRSSGRNKKMAEYNYFLQNGAGKYYHPVLGFGLLNATTLVGLAKNMKPLPQQVKITVASQFAKSKSFHKSVEVYVTIPCKNNLCVTSLEHVVATVSFRAQRMDYCELILISPAATSSLLMDKFQENDTGPGRYKAVQFLSVHFWGEKAAGRWTLVMKQYGNFAPGSFGISEFRLSVFGTGVDTTATKVSTPNTTPMPTAGISSSVIGLIVSMIIIVIVGIAALLLFFGFRKRIKVKWQNRYSSMKDDKIDTEN